LAVKEKPGMVCVVCEIANRRRGRPVKALQRLGPKLRMRLSPADRDAWDLVRYEKEVLIRDETHEHHVGRILHTEPPVHTRIGKGKPVNSAQKSPSEERKVVYVGSAHGASVPKRRTDKGAVLKYFKREGTRCSSSSRDRD
jgi:hypothetical protein